MFLLYHNDSQQQWHPVLAAKHILFTMHVVYPLLSFIVSLTQLTHSWLSKAIVYELVCAISYLCHEGLFVQQCFTKRRVWPKSQGNTKGTE